MATGMVQALAQMQDRQHQMVIVWKTGPAGVRPAEPERVGG